MDIRKELKVILAKKSMSQRELAESHNITPVGLSKKITKGSFSVNEFEAWLKELGYKLVIVEDDDQETD